MPLAELAQPYLERISLAVHESSSVGILDGADIVYIARSPVSRIMSINLRVGSRLPAYCTSIGRILLAHLPEAPVDAYFQQLRPVRTHPKTTCSIPQLRQVLRAVRTDGFAIIDQELEIGLRSVAVPIRDAKGQVVAAMNCGAQAARINLRGLESRIVPVLRSAADELGPLLLNEARR